MLARAVGDIGVSTFSILSFIYSLANAILSGTAQGLQPLWGNSFGRQNTNEMRFLLKCGLVINLVLSICVYILLSVFDREIISIFNRDTELVETASLALPLFCLSFIPMALNLIFTAFMFSTKRTGEATAIAVSRGILIKAVAIFLLPALLGIDGIWLAPFAAELMTLLFAVYIFVKIFQKV
ncbi:MAG: MATE family efflux transporter [Eubacteriales bacterium]|nr:MATE family efflux transporter [Eubacteriales bacterium]